jgi:general secretion pathway protein K
VAAATADWIDSDQTAAPQGAEDDAYRGLATPYRTGDTLLADVSEWRAVRGVTPRLFARMRPWVCALPVAEMSALNVNLLRADQAPLLAMLAPQQLSVARARAVLAMRPRAGYGSATRFWQQPALADVRPPPDTAAQVQVKSRWFAVESRVDIGGFEVSQRALVDAGTGGNDAAAAAPRVVRRQWGEGE